MAKNISNTMEEILKSEKKNSKAKLWVQSRCVHHNKSDNLAIVKKHDDGSGKTNYLCKECFKQNIKLNKLGEFTRDEVEQLIGKSKLDVGIDIMDTAFDTIKIVTGNTKNEADQEKLKEISDSQYFILNDLPKLYGKVIDKKNNKNNNKNNGYRNGSGNNNEAGRWMKSLN